MKLCDPALSKDLFPGDYHCLGDNENRPVKWMAIESIASASFAPSSDVWSWAVTMWEVKSSIYKIDYLLKFSSYKHFNVLRFSVRTSKAEQCHTRVPSNSLYQTSYGLKVLSSQVITWISYLH